MTDTLGLQATIKNNTQDRQHLDARAAVSEHKSAIMTTKSSFLPRLSLSRNENTSILPMHNSRYSSLRSRPSEYDLDELSPHPDDGVLSPDFHDPNSPIATNVNTKSSNRKPTGALNRRPSNSSSSAGSAPKTRSHHLHGEGVLFSGPPPPIAASRILYRDEEQRHGFAGYADENDGEDGSNIGGLAASWLPGTARRAISSVIWDRGDTRVAQDNGAKPVTFDRNSEWRSLARREKSLVSELQMFLQVQEDSLSGGGGRDDSSRYDDGTNVSDGGSVTPTVAASVISSRNPGRSVSFLEPPTRSGPSGEIIPVRQPRAKKLGVGAARRGIARSMAELANLKAEEDASLTSALSTRKRALANLRKLSTRRDGIADELRALEADEEEPLRVELQELEGEHRGVCTEIQELEEQLARLKSRRRHLEGRMDDVRNRREAGLSGYKNALKEVEHAVKGFLIRPPVKPLDVDALAENTKDENPPPSPGGIEFMHLRPERRTVEMAREWWEAEIGILEKRKADVDAERAALEEGSDVWEEVVNVVLGFEADLRQQMTRCGSGSSNAASDAAGGKGKEREPTIADTLKLQHDKFNGVIAGLEQRLSAAEAKGWNLLIAAIGAELEAFKAAACVNREMLDAAGIVVDEPSPVEGQSGVFREDSGTTSGSHASFHTVKGGSAIAEQRGAPLAARGVAESDDDDGQVPPDLLATAHEDDYHAEDDGQQPPPEQDDRGGRRIEDGAVAGDASLFDKEESENEIPPEFLVEPHDTRGGFRPRA